MGQPVEGPDGRSYGSGDNQSPEGEFGTDQGMRSRVRWGCPAQPLALQGQSTLIPDAGAREHPAGAGPAHGGGRPGTAGYRRAGCRGVVPMVLRASGTLPPRPGQLLLEHAVTRHLSGTQVSPGSQRPRGADLGGRGPQRVREPLPSLLTAWTSRTHLPPKAKAPWKPLSRPRWGKRAGELGASQGPVASPARLAQGPKHLLRAGLAGGRGVSSRKTHMDGHAGRRLACWPGKQAGRSEVLGSCFPRAAQPRGPLLPHGPLQPRELLPTPQADNCRTARVRPGSRSQTHSASPGPGQGLGAARRPPSHRAAPGRGGATGMPSQGRGQAGKAVQREPYLRAGHWPG